MKFLVFNVIVLCSLGYMLTSKPNENFNQWFSNTKDKITNLSKEEVVKTIKKATSSNKLIEDNEIKKTPDEIKKVNTEINLNKDKKITNEVKIQENTKIANSDINEDKEKKPVDNEIKKIINDILEAKNKKTFQEKVKIDDGEAYKKEKIKQKVEISEEKFMSLDERENALAELIIDMELLHLNTLK
jgi:poly(A) polymerase Pap1